MQHPTKRTLSQQFILISLTAAMILCGASGLAAQTRFAYTVNSDGNSLSVHSIDPLTGALTAVGTVTTGQSPKAAAVDVSGQFLYVANANSNTVTTFRINASTGGLTSIQSIGTVSPTAIAV